MKLAFLPVLFAFALSAAAPERRVLFPDEEAAASVIDTNPHVQEDGEESKGNASYHHYLHNQGEHSGHQHVHHEHHEANGSHKHDGQFKMSHTEKMMMKMTEHSLCSTGSDWCEEPDEYPVDLAANIIKKMKQESESDGGIDDAAVLKKKTKTAAVKNGLDGGAATSAVSSRKMKQKTLMSTFFLPIVDGQVFTEDGEVIRIVPAVEEYDEAARGGIGLHGPSPRMSDVLEKSRMAIPLSERNEEPDELDDEGGVSEDTGSMASISSHLDAGSGSGSSVGAGSGSQLSRSLSIDNEEFLLPMSPVHSASTTSLAPREPHATFTATAQAATATTSTSTTLTTPPPLLSSTGRRYLPPSQNEINESPMCKSNPSYVFPKRGLTMDGEYRFILSDRTAQIVQAVRIETCHRQDSPCVLGNGLSFMDFGIQTVCRQQYSYRQLLVVSDTGEQEVDRFRFPSACRCHHVIGDNRFA